MSLLLERPYVLLRDVIGSTVDYNGLPRFPDDTVLIAGTVFVVVEDKHPWPKPDSPVLHYIVEPRVVGTKSPQGGRYAVAAGNLEAAIESKAA